MKNLHYFKGSFIFAAVAVLLGYMMGGLAGAYSVLVLGILETSLSVDNAVVNAKKLETMSHFWRNMFITAGMLVAVFGMRLLFPIVIVGVSVHMDMLPSLGIALQNLMGSHIPYNDNVIFMALNDPMRYADILKGAHTNIAGFGGAFLMLVCLKFFIDKEKDNHWLEIIEEPLAKLGKFEAVQIAITIPTLFLVSQYLPNGTNTAFFMSGMFGILAYLIVDGIGVLLDDEDTSGNSSAVSIVKSGIAAFIYLEVLDASFSFDGVIGAFAITHDLFIIALGLGVGAMFVRSATIMLVEQGTLAEFAFLEHGAFYAIGSLAGIMLISSIVHIPDVISGSIGAAFIGIALWASNLNKSSIAIVDEPPVVGHLEDHISIKALKSSPFFKSHQ